VQQLGSCAGEQTALTQALQLVHCRCPTVHGSWQLQDGCVVVVVARVVVVVTGARVVVVVGKVVVVDGCVVVVAMVVVVGRVVVVATGVVVVVGRVVVVVNVVVVVGRVVVVVAGRVVVVVVVGRVVVVVGRVVVVGGRVVDVVEVVVVVEPPFPPFLVAATAGQPPAVRASQQLEQAPTLPLIAAHASSSGSRRQVVPLVQTTAAERPQIDRAAHRRAATAQSADTTPVPTSSLTAFAAHRT
jgi:hypothetical protein